VRLEGRLRTTRPQADYTGHGVRLQFQERVALADGEDRTYVPTERAAPVQPDGTFALELPPQNQTRSPWTLQVLGPSGAELLRQTLDQLPERLEVDADPAALPDPAGDPTSRPRTRDRLQGRVLHETGCRLPSGLQVVLYAARPGSEDLQPVVAARTNVEGYFAADLPEGRFARAVGRISGSGAVEEVPVPLDPEGAFPRRVILVVRLFDRPGEEVCACDGDRAATLAPEPEDLVSAPGAYTADLGGCVRFDVPNRAIEEFSYYAVVRTTDPEIKGLNLGRPQTLPPRVLDALLDQVALATPGKMTRALRARAAEAAPGAGPTLDDLVERKAADRKTLRALSRGTSALRIDPAVIAQLAKDADGFTPAHLMTAERLSAFQKVRGALELLRRGVAGRGTLTADNPVDWDDEPTFYQATTIACGHLLHFKQVWRANGYSLGDLLYSLPLAPGQKKEIVVLDWERRESAARMEEVGFREELQAQLTRDRDVTEIVDSVLRESTRGGSTAATAGLGFGVGGFAGVLFGVAGGAGVSTSSAWQNSSRALTSQAGQYLRDRTVQAASAVRSMRSTVVQTATQGETMRVQTEVVANHNHCHALTIQYFEVLRHLLVSQELVDVQECLFVPLLMSKFDSAKALRWRAALHRHLRDRTLSGGFDALERIANHYDGSDLPLGRYEEETLEDLDGDLKLSFVLARPRDDSDGGFDAATWTVLAPLLWADPFALFNQYLRDRAQAERDRIWRTEIAPRVAERFVQQLEFYLVHPDGSEVGPLPVDATLVSRYAPDTPLHVTLRLAADLPPVRRADIRAVRIFPKAALPAESKVLVHSGSMRYRTAHLSHHLFRDARILNDLRTDQPDACRVATPTDRVERRNPREEDRELARQLLAHLNEHIEYYHKAIWWEMDPDRRYMLLDGFVAPNSGGRSVASVVENRLLGIVGNCLVLPVARGFHLDPTFKADPGDPELLLRHYQPTTPIPPVQVSVPTRGVFAEAVMGQCNSCETIDDTRFWRWHEAPIDEPTDIQPVSTESRRSDVPDVRPSAMPAPLIAMQNAPAAPDPTGLAVAAQLLGNPNLFRDITGLAANQQNALAAFQSSLEAAKFFAQEGGKLRMQERMLEQADRALQRVRQARERGMITPEQERELTVEALRTMMSGQSTPGEVTRQIERARAQGLLDSEQASKLTERALRSWAEGTSPQATPRLTEEAPVETLLRRASAQPGASVSVTRGAESVQVRTAAAREPVQEVCGFFGPQGVVSEEDLRDAIRLVAERERRNWRDASGAVLSEGDDSQFGHLVRYWLARYSAISPLTVTHAQTQALASTTNYGALLDANPTEAQVNAAADAARQALLAGAPGSANPPNLDDLVEEALRNARGSRRDAIPWSAVFVSACVRRAAVQLGLEAEVAGRIVGRDGLLRYHDAHRVYVREAYRRRFQDRRDGTYHAFRPDERAVQVGDIVVLDRQANRLEDVVAFDDIPTVLAGGRALHGDVVVEVSDGYCVAIGGNLSQTVRRRRYPLDAQGRLVVAEGQQFTQEADNGSLAAIPAAGPATGALHDLSTGRIFALLSLAQACLAVPGQPLEGGVLV